jgi:predicted carbohydrate-binding protein with CBM5 and CBM33 domain
VRKRERRVLGFAAILFALIATVFWAAPSAQAHGAPISPGSRTYLCWKDGLTQSGQIIPNNPACAAAIAQTGATPLYNWFAVLRSDAAGRTTGYIPDGQLCSGGSGGPYDFTGFNAVRNDWPLTHLTSGANWQLRYNNWAQHPGTFYAYVTRNGWDASQPVRWSDLELFDTEVNPPATGGPGSAENYYYWNATLPSGKSGRHVIYMRWVRSDSSENFFSCSDVTFDGGNGEVTGIGPGSGPGPGPGPDPTPGDCSATLRITNPWSGGYQGEVTIRNTGTAPINGWTASWSFTNSETINSLWGGTYAQTASTVTVRNAEWNRTIAPNGTTTVGFVASGTSPTVPTLACSSP